MKHTKLPCLSRPRVGRFGLTMACLLSIPLAVFSQTAPAATEGETIKLEKFTVTGSFIPQASAEPIAPVATFTESEIRATGATTVIQALRNLPSFVGNPGPTEFDSNGGVGATAVSLRGLGAGQTLVLIDGKQTLQFGNIQLIPIEAVDRVEVLRDGAGIIYGSAAIGGAVNVILKKSYTGSVVNVFAGGATRTPGGRDTFQASFAAGAAVNGTSVMVAGSYFRNRTIFASQRPNSARSDNRRFGGVNGGSPTFPGVISANGAPKVLRPDFPANTTPTPADYITLDTNTFSSNQLFNFRQFSPSAPGQERNALLVNFEQVLTPKITLFANVLYSKLGTANGLAPAPFALDSDPAGPAVGSVTSFGPYNQGILNPAAGDFFRYRSIELGNRTNDQTFEDYHWQTGLRGDITATWKWEAAMTIENELLRVDDGGVPSLPLLDAEIQAGRFNPFAQAFSKGSAVIGGQTFTWDNEKALKASGIQARRLFTTHDRQFNGSVNGTLLELPAGDVGFAAGVEHITSTVDTRVDDLYRSGSVLGLNQADNSFTKFESRSFFSEIKVPLVSEANKMPFIHSLSIGALARQETQKNTGLNTNSGRVETREYKKVNPSVNLHYSPTPDYLVRMTWAKGFLAPGIGAVFGSPGQTNPTITDPLGFPTNAQTTIVIRSNPELKPAESQAVSFGFVGTPRGFIKNLTFSVDFYHIKVSGIVANNSAQILALNAAGQGPGFVPGNAATINPNAPFANLIRRSSNGRLSSNGSFQSAFGIASRGAVLSDSLNIGQNDVEGLEYTVGYTYNTQDWGRFRFNLAANQFLRFVQNKGLGLAPVNYVGRFVSTAGDNISPGSIPRWRGNFGTMWTWKNFTTNLNITYTQSYQDDPLFVLSPKMQAFFDAGTPKSDPTFAAFLADINQPKVGGFRKIGAFIPVDLQVSYDFKGEGFMKGLSWTVGSNNILDKLAPFAAGAFNDSYDTRTHNNVGRFVYTSIRKQF